MSENGKPKFGMYWASSCGGCEIAVLNIGDHILDVDAVFDVVFWPVAADFKYEDVRNYPDGYIDLCLFNGAIRNSENEEMAKLLRQQVQGAGRLRFVRLRRAASRRCPTSRPKKRPCAPSTWTTRRSTTRTACCRSR